MVEYSPQALTAARKGSGITYAELAKASGIGVTTIWRYEKGETCPTVDKWARLMSAIKKGKRNAQASKKVVKKA